MLETDSTRHFTSMMDRVPLLLTFTQRSVTATCAGITPPRGKAVTKMRMTRKSPKSFLDAKSCVESISEVFFEVPARPDELGTLLVAGDSRNHTAQTLLVAAD